MKGPRPLVLFLVAVLVAAAGLPAAAGSRDDPEITDRCGDLGEPHDLRATPEWVDVCAGWFETLSEDPEDTPEMRVTLQLAGEVADRTASFYWAFWDTGGCMYRVGRDDAPDGPLSDPLVWLEAWCDGFDEPTVHVPLDGAWSEDGDTVSWTLRFDGDLAGFAGHHAPGSRLAAPRVVPDPAPPPTTLTAPGWPPRGRSPACAPARCTGGRSAARSGTRRGRAAASRRSATGPRPGAPTRSAPDPREGTPWQRSLNAASAGVAWFSRCAWCCRSSPWRRPRRAPPTTPT